MRDHSRFERLARAFGSGDRLPIDPDLAPDDPSEPSVLHRPAATVIHRRDPRVLATIAVGGAAGTIGRYGVGLLAPVQQGAFPVATFIINTTGAFLLGLILTVILERFPHTKYVRPLTCVGILGSWTTMSTFVTEVDLLAFNDRRALLAVSYMLATFTAGVAATLIGIALGRRRTEESS